MKRKNGYYKVRIIDSWIIAEWKDDCFLITGSIYEFDEWAFREIDENPILLI